VSDLDAIRARLAAATPGPWHWAHHGTWEVEAPPNQLVADCGTVGRAKADAALIAHAPADLAALLAEVDDLQSAVRSHWAAAQSLAAEVERLRELSMVQSSNETFLQVEVDAVGDLLAVILGDGGHRQAEAGTVQAAAEALERVHALHQREAERPKTARSLMAEAVDCEALRHVPARSDRDLLIQAIRHAGRTGPRRVRWATVADLLGHGSTVSYALCVAAGLDGDEMVGVDDDSEEVDRG
jgi:hypothetical protein